MHHGVSKQINKFLPLSFDVPAFLQGNGAVFGPPCVLCISPVPTISGERSPVRHLGRRSMGDQ